MKPIFVIFTVAVLSFLMVACSSNSSRSSPPPEAAKKQGGIGPKACRSTGGRWIRGGTLMMFGCLRHSPDAGKSCTHSNQCKYHCNARPEDTRRTGQAATGQCQKNNSYTGCKSEIKDGIVQPTFCVKI